MKPDQSVVNATCGCPARASVKCKHIAAVILYINNENGMSRTNLPQLWDIPSKFA